MKSFLHFLLTSIVNHPDNILIEEEINDDHLALKLTVAEADMGVVIGKHGQTIAALRTIVRLRNQVTQEFTSVVVHLQEHAQPETSIS